MTSLHTLGPGVFSEMFLWWKEELIKLSEVSCTNLKRVNPNIS